MARKFDRWVLLGYIAAIFNPLPTGLVAGYILYRERKYRTHGLIVFILSVFLTILSFALLYYYPSGFV